MQRFLFSSLIGLFAVVLLPLGAHAQTTVSLRTGMVDAINSITLVDQTAEVRHGGSLPVAIYRLDFSITAEDSDLLLPKAVTRGASDASGLEFLVESRDGETTESGFAAGILIADGKSSFGNSYVIKAGTTETFSLLAVFADEADSSREDRLRISGMTLATVGIKAELNPSELEELRTDFIELVETR